MSGLSASQIAAVYSLLADLQLQRFAIGVGHHLRLERLLARLEGPRSSEELKTLLCPLFATDETTQEAFYRAFARHFPPDDLPPPAIEAEPPGSGGAEVEVRGRRRRVPGLTLLVASALLVAGFSAYLTYLWLPEPPLPPVLQEPVPEEAGRLPPPAAAPDPREPADVRPQEDRPQEVWPSALLGLLVFLLLLQLGLRHRRRALALERARQRKPPFSWPLRAPAPEIRDYRSDLFYRTARLLRRRRISDAQRLDIPRTIDATLQAGGFPTLRSRPDSVFPEYLALIRRSSLRDHQACLFDRLTKVLAREGLFLERYFYDGDPRICSTGDGLRSVRLLELQKRYPEHRLLLFSDGEELLDPVSGELAPWVALLLDWRQRALLTPRDEAAWGLSERTLGEAFLVLPASVRGLSELADHLELPARPGGRDRIPPGEARPPLSTPERSVTADELQSHLGEPAFQWLCACAAYPELHWDMTLYLGALPTIGGGSLREEPLLRLARLPWLRGGSLPDGLRLQLLERLGPAREHEVREAVAELLRANPARPGSFAASSRELQVVAQSAYLARRDPRAWRRILRRLRAFPHADIAADRALLRLLKRGPVSRLALRLPDALREILFERGVPAFGLRTAVHAVFTLVVAVAALSLVRLPPPVVEAEAEVPATTEPAIGTEPAEETEPPQLTETEPEIEEPVGTEPTEPALGTETAEPTEPPQPTETEPEIGGPVGTEPSGPVLGTETPKPTEPSEPTEANPETGGPGGTGPNPAKQDDPTAGPSGDTGDKDTPGEGVTMPAGAADVKQAILAELGRFTKPPIKGDNLFLAGSIPPERLEYAREVTKLPRDEEVIALIDNSAAGMLRNVLVFGRRGIYRGLGGRSAYTPYEEYIKLDFKVKNRVLKTISGGEWTFSFIGSSFSAKTLVEILNAVKGALQKLEPSGAGPDE